MIRVSFCMSSLSSPSPTLLAGGRRETCHIRESSSDGTSSRGNPFTGRWETEGFPKLGVSRLLPAPVARLVGNRLRAYERHC